MKLLVINCCPVRTGATAFIADTVTAFFEPDHEVKSICIDDFSVAMCKGCRVCHETAVCVQQDDVGQIMERFEWADVIIAVSPSYWADVPGQFKAFIDRCTPWCNTHQPHASLSGGKKGYAVALRTGPGMKECQRITETIAHFFGHLEIECAGSLGLCSVENRRDAEKRAGEVMAFCEQIGADIA